MTFLKINGVTIPVAADSFEEESIAIGDIFNMGITGGGFGSQSATKRRWTFQTTPIERVEAEKFRQWIEGRQQVFPLADTASLSIIKSGDGVSMTGSSLAYSTPGKHDGYAQVGSGTMASALMRNKLYLPNGWTPTTGWTHGVWSYRTIASDGTPADAWYDYVATGAIEVTRGSAANPVGVTQYRDGVAGSYSWGNWSSVRNSGDLVGFGGYRAGGLAAAKNYEDFFFLPYEIPSTWIAELTTFRQSYTMGLAPVVKATGDWFVESDPINVICRVRATKQLNAKLRGASSHSAANRIFSVEMMEQ